MDKIKDLVFISLQVNFRLQEMLRRLVYDLKMNRSEVIRHLIEQEYHKRYREEPK